MSRAYLSAAAARAAFAAAFASAVTGAGAAVVPCAPADGSEVRLLSAALKGIISLPDKESRYDALAPERDGRGEGRADSRAWRHPGPVVLRWRATAGETGPWMVRIAADPAFGLFDEYVFLPEDAAGAAKEDGSVEWSCELPNPNFEAGRRYWWKVWSGVRCMDWGCGASMIGATGPCPCGRSSPSVESAAAAFTTEDTPPRFIDLEGRVGNVRDLGGWKTETGRRVRQGMIYRGQGLNDNSKSGLRRGRNRLTVEDVEYMSGRLGIRTDLDLRSGWETAGMSGSPLGPGVRFVHSSSASYRGIFERAGMETMAKNFRLFCDRANYPIYFHCIAGADRTGSLAYILNGLLGVSGHDLEIDWEVTFYPKMHGVREEGKTKKDWRGTHWFDEGLAKYGDAGSPLSERVELYLKDCGVTGDEIARFREIMLGPPEDPNR